VLVSLDKKKGYVDLRGNIVVELKYDNEDAMPFGECGLASIREGGKWGLIDVTGRFVLPPRFANASNFGRDGLAIVSVERKEGEDEKIIAYNWSGMNYCINIRTGEASIADPEQRPW
jgi:hypothetical protein